MAKRIGAVVTFKAGVSPAQAAEALAKIAEVIEVPATAGCYKPEFYKVVSGKETKTVRYREVPFSFEYMVHEYDDMYGGPVWYIP